MTFIFYFSIIAFIILSVLLCLVILIQESKSMGLGASFGGDAGESLFGTATADVLKKFTTWLAIIFVASCIILSLWTANMGHIKKSVNPADIESIQGFPQ